MDTDPLPALEALASAPGADPLSTLAAIAPQTLHSLAAISFQAPPDWAGWSVCMAIAGLCLLMSAFVSGSEIAFFGIGPRQLEELREETGADARRVCLLLDHSERLLATILIANNLVNITLVILLTFCIGQTVEFSSPVLSFLLQTVLLTFLLLLFGEVLPKLAARSKGMEWARMASGGIMALYRALGLPARLMAHGSGFVARMVEQRRESISTDDLSQALEITDVKEKRDKEMLEGILTFGEKQVSDIMTGRLDVTAIELHSPWRQVVSVILESGYSRIPVYDSDPDAIKGILYSKDLLPWLERAGEDFAWQGMIRKAYIVPESRMIDDLLEDFRRKKIHIAVVVDEYGGTQGIVTLEDILE